MKQLIKLAEDCSKYVKIWKICNGELLDFDGYPIDFQMVGICDKSFIENMSSDDMVKKGFKASSLPYSGEPTITINCFETIEELLKAVK